MRRYLLAVILLLLIGICLGVTKKTHPSRQDYEDEDEEGDYDEAINTELLEQQARAKSSPSTPVAKKTDQAHEDVILITFPFLISLLFLMLFRMQEFIEDLDEEEFVGGGAKEPKQPKIIEGGDAPELKPPPPRNYVIEYVYVPLLVLYVVVFFVGKAINESIARKWASANEETLNENFTKVNEKSVLVRVTSSEYRIQATGRTHCAGMVAFLDLRKRHDLFSLVLSSFGLFYSAYDQMTIDVPLNELEPFVFAVVKKRNEATFRKENTDVSECCRKLTATAAQFGLPESYILLAEEEEPCKAILAPGFRDALTLYEQKILQVYITDQNNASTEYKKLLRVVFKVVDPVNETAILKFALNLIDVVSSIRLDRAELTRAQKRRSKISEQAEKEKKSEQEEAMRKKKAEALAALSPEQQRKREEKEKEKEARKALKKRTKIKMIG